MINRMIEKTYKVESELLKETVFVKILREPNFYINEKGIAEIEEVKQIAISHIKDRLKVTEIPIEL